MEIVQVWAAHAHACAHATMPPAHSLLFPVPLCLCPASLIHPYVCALMRLRSTSVCPCACASPCPCTAPQTLRVISCTSQQRKWAARAGC